MSTDTSPFFPRGEVGIGPFFVAYDLSSFVFGIGAYFTKKMFYGWVRLGPFNIGYDSQRQRHLRMLKELSA